MSRMPIDLRPEIDLQTARSGGHGGQHVNKVETLVLGRWNPAESRLLDDTQKAQVLHRLAHRLTQSGELLVRSQEARTQWENKEIVMEKMNALLAQALRRMKPRIATKPTKASREKRLENKKKRAELKSGRGRYRF